MYLLQDQAGAFDNLLELRWRSLDAVDNRHHGDVSLVAVTRERSVVRRKRFRRGWDLRTAQSRVHHLVTDQEARGRAHGLPDCCEDLNAVWVRPVVAINGIGVLACFSGRNE